MPLAPDTSLPIAAPGALREPADRRRLSGSAIRLFLRVAELWSLTVEDQRAILGDVSKQTFYNWKNGKVGALTRDQLERISLVLGIVKALRLIFVDDTAGIRWLRADNTELTFGGGSPLARMTAGGVTDLYDVRRYLDAWRGVK